MGAGQRLSKPRLDAAGIAWRQRGDRAKLKSSCPRVPTPSLRGSATPRAYLTHQLLLLYIYFVSTNTAPDLATAARLFHALSDETRLALLEMLQDGERCVCELQDELDAAQSRLSFHLKVLKDAGLVLDRRDGRWVYYSLNKESLDDATGFIKAMKPHRRLTVIDTACCD